ncbi:hypothetical protein [Bifidobacterium choloepi]|uniref:SWIM-type domain-containing protein n=1 Tax=Bifidobacterium choloepi TaxID=2614131 RepID=A0A6I5N9F1_9BIFI|nr:hypothetical protein [Bifidobacterium choloepi]NEG69120.1 hypothetical protein [Bifidobacterium choloepi]
MMEDPQSGLFSRYLEPVRVACLPDRLFADGNSDDAYADHVGVVLADSFYGLVFDQFEQFNSSPTDDGDDDWDIPDEWPTLAQVSETVFDSPSPSVPQWWHAVFDGTYLVLYDESRRVRPVAAWHMVQGDNRGLPKPETFRQCRDIGLLRALSAGNQLRYLAEQIPVGRTLDALAYGDLRSPVMQKAEVAWKWWVDNTGPELLPSGRQDEMLGRQASGCVGERGQLPFGTYMARVRDQFERREYVTALCIKDGTLVSMGCECLQERECAHPDKPFEICAHLTGAVLAIRELPNSYFEFVATGRSWPDVLFNGNLGPYPAHPDRGDLVPYFIALFHHRQLMPELENLRDLEAVGPTHAIEYALEVARLHDLVVPRIIRDVAMECLFEGNDE